eukprot:scaffold1867_cov247-Pinguiococcus_pyrenoidosus.AAC.9
MGGKPQMSRTCRSCWSQRIGETLEATGVSQGVIRTSPLSTSKALLGGIRVLRRRLRLLSCCISLKSVRFTGKASRCRLGGRSESVGVHGKSSEPGGGENTALHDWTSFGCVGAALALCILLGLRRPLLISAKALASGTARQCATPACAKALRLVTSPALLLRCMFAAGPEGSQRSGRWSDELS